MEKRRNRARFWCSVVLLLGIVVLPGRGEAETSLFVPPVAGPIRYSPCPVNSGAPFDETRPQDWYSVAWSGQYSEVTGSRCEGSGGHPGVDIRDRYAEDNGDFGVYAIRDGVVIVKKYLGRGWGRTIVIQHDNVPGHGTLYSVYAHLKSFEPKIRKEKAGEVTVETGEKIGTMGYSGLGDPAQRHLHFQIELKWNDSTAEGRCSQRGKPFWPCYTDTDKKGRDILRPYPSSNKTCGPEIDNCLTEAQRQEAAAYVAKNTMNPMLLVEGSSQELTSRAWLASSVIGNAVYTLGGGVCEGAGCGMFGGGQVQNVETYNALVRVVIPKSDLLVGRFGLSAVESGGKLYVLGGISGCCSFPEAQVEEYDPASNEWTLKTLMPTARWKLTSAAVAGKIYTIGGGASGNQCVPSNVVEEYDPVNNTWDTKLPMPTARWGAANAVIDGQVYVVGGSRLCPHILIDPSAALEAYSPSLNVWTVLPAMATRRWDLAAAAVNGKIYAMGGWDPVTESVLPTVEEFDPATNTWSTKSSMPTARSGLVVATVGDKIYALGGFDGLNVTNIIEIYDPATDTWFP